MTKSRRFLIKTHIFLSLAPWLTLLTWTAYALAARMVLGHFPHIIDEFRPCNSSVADVFDTAYFVSVAFALLSLPLWVGLSVWRVVRWKDRSIWRAAVILVLGWVAGQIIFTIDPLGFTAWLYP